MPVPTKHPTRPLPMMTPANTTSSPVGDCVTGGRLPRKFSSLPDANARGFFQQIPAPSAFRQLLRKRNVTQSGPKNRSPRLKEMTCHHGSAPTNPRSRHRTRGAKLSRIKLTDCQLLPSHEHATDHALTLRACQRSVTIVCSFLPKGTLSCAICFAASLAHTAIGACLSSGPLSLAE